MKVFDIMSEHTVTVGLGEPVAAAARLLKQYNIGAFPFATSEAICAA